MTHPAPDEATEPAPTVTQSIDRPVVTRRHVQGRRPAAGGTVVASTNRDRANDPATAVSTTDELLRVLISLTGRVAVPEPRLRTLVVGRNARSGEKYLAAYNLCDGSRGVREIARISGLDHGNLSRAIIRWVEQGVMFKLGSDARPVHLYRLSLTARDEDGAVASDASAPPEGVTASPAAVTRSPRRARDSRNTSDPAHNEELFELPFDQRSREDSGQ